MLIIIKQFPDTMLLYLTVSVGESTRFNFQKMNAIIYTNPGLVLSTYTVLYALSSPSVLSCVPICSALLKIVCTSLCDHVYTTFCSLCMLISYYLQFDKLI